jgi:hypothetical protein
MVTVGTWGQSTGRTNKSQRASVDEVWANKSMVHLSSLDGDCEVEKSRNGFKGLVRKVMNKF